MPRSLFFPSLVTSSSDLQTVLTPVTIGFKFGSLALLYCRTRLTSSIRLTWRSALRVSVYPPERTLPALHPSGVYRIYSPSLRNLPIRDKLDVPSHYWSSFFFRSPLSDSFGASSKFLRKSFPFFTLLNSIDDGLSARLRRIISHRIFDGQRFRPGSYGFVSGQGLLTNGGPCEYSPFTLYSTVVLPRLFLYITVQSP